MESTTTPTPTSSTPNFDLQDSSFLGCSSWNPIFSTSGTSSNSSFNNKLYGNESESILSTTMVDNDARHLSYLSSNLPKIEEDMLGSFSNFSSLLNSNPSMENEASWFNGFPSGGAQYYSSRGLMQDHSTSLLNQLGLVSSPSFLSSASASATTPRLGLNLQAMDFFGTNSYHALGEQLISPPMSNKSTSGALMNGITGTKRGAGSYRSDEAKASTSSNSAAPTKKSQLKVSCPPFKVRKEKLGDRIAALHQLVSPFGKTDTASVLTEGIGYIQFLQDQIHTLCMPHAKAPRNKPCRQLGMTLTEEEGKEEGRAVVGLGRRGLCLVPLSWTSFITPTQLDLDSSNQSFF